MSTQPRTEEQIRTLCSKMTANLRDELRSGMGKVTPYKSSAELTALEDATRQRSIDAMQRRAFLSGLLWCLGGCINPYHPPECDGMREECMEEQ